ncbi:hypothetical protein CBR_g34444 [Chara braunii]|uniref:Uncharacterized protein n=1 Tax=Chara braunii TaxID=69332 RepID=A0A388LIU9_CHABU|nr:hypothetical protein CBR_g34444 [Chara braunii]|eukprot:GBG82163.1 hypothetical protein CBR_g34444 [Chara braunii]
MVGNTTALPSGAVRDDSRVQAMLSPEVMASLSALAHSPTTVLELLRSQTPQQPPSKPLEYEIEDVIPPDIARLPGPIVCRDDYTVMPDNVWGHHIIWHPHHFQPALARGNWVMTIKEEGEWQFCLHRRMSQSKFVTHTKNQIGKRLLRLNPKVPQSRLDARTEEIFQEFKTSRWLEYLEEFYDQETSPTFGYIWHIEEQLQDKVGERKGASGDESGKGSGLGGGALGKGTRSSCGEHGKGSEPRGGVSGKGLGPSVGASGKPMSHGELQKHEMCQGRQATEGKVSGPSGGAHDKGSGSPLGSGPSSGAHCRGSGSPLGLGPSGGAHGRGSRGDASDQDLGASGGASGGASVKGVSHGELPKCVEEVLPDYQVWATTVLASESVTAQVDNTGALAELEMPSLDMPVEVSLDMRNESATASAKETVNVQAIEEDEGHIVLSTWEQHTLVQPELMLAKSEAQQSANLVISIDESPFTPSHGAIEGRVEDKVLVSHRGEHILISREYLMLYAD